MTERGEPAAGLPPINPEKFACGVGDVQSAGLPASTGPPTSTTPASEPEGTGGLNTGARRTADCMVPPAAPAPAREDPPLAEPGRSALTTSEVSAGSINGSGRP